MTSYYNALKALINPQMINSAARTVEESETSVSKAVNSIISGLMGVMLKKGNTPQLTNIFEEAGNLNILIGEHNIFEEKPTLDQQRIGDDFLQHLLGDKASMFTAPIADSANISKVAVNRLVSMVAPIFSGLFGNKLVKENMTMGQIFRDIRDEKSQFVKNIPLELINNFGLTSVLGDEVSKETKKNYNWLIWAGLIALLILIFLGWRSCKDDIFTGDSSSTVLVTDTISQELKNRENATSNNNVSATNNSQKETTEVILPDGAKLTVYKGGVEEKMIDFLKSDEYKNAKDSELKDKWFEFDNLAFVFGSSTELASDAKTQLNNLIVILKQYKDAKIKIAGFADKKGTESANMKVSQERAKTIEKLLEEGGVGSQVVKTEGYGDEYAKHSASDSDKERAEDRDIALRFVK